MSCRGGCKEAGVSGAARAEGEAEGCWVLWCAMCPVTHPHVPSDSPSVFHCYMELHMPWKLAATWLVHAHVLLVSCEADGIDAYACVGMWSLSVQHSHSRSLPCSGLSTLQHSALNARHSTVSSSQPTSNMQHSMFNLLQHARVSSFHDMSAEAVHQRSFTRKHLARQPFIEFKRAKVLLNMGAPLRKRLLQEKNIHITAGPMKAAAAVADASPGGNKRKRSSNPGRRQQPTGMTT